MDGPLLSVVTPVYNEAESLAAFAEVLRQTLDAAGIRWEWLAVEDASTDDSRRILNDMAAGEPRLHVLAQPRNSGSHAAILRGLREARGDFAVALAADLQDPPEIIPRLLREAQRSGPSLVWAARLRASGATACDRFLATSYHLAVRLWTGLPDPKFGADCFLASREVLDAVAQWPDPGSSLFFRLLTLPVRQRSIGYERRDRIGGASSWTLQRKLRFAFSSLLGGTNPAAWLGRLSAAAWRVGQILAAPGAASTIDRLIREWLAQHPECRLHLDAGCGSSSRLSATGVEVVGVDSDAARIALFRNRGGDGAVASSIALPFGDGTFDAVWSFGLLHHLTDAECQQTLAEMRRVTRPGGWIIVFDALPPLKPRRRPLAAWIRRIDAGQHLRTEEQLRAALAVGGAWPGQRLTYAWNGLEALYCTHHNQPGSSPISSPCPSPPTSN